MYSIEINVFFLAFIAFILIGFAVRLKLELRDHDHYIKRIAELSETLGQMMDREQELYDDSCKKRTTERELVSRLAHAQHLVQKLISTCEQQAQTILNMTNSHEMILDEIDSLLIGNAKRELGGTVIERVPGNGPTLADDPFPELIDPHMFQD